MSSVSTPVENQCLSTEVTNSDHVSSEIVPVDRRRLEQLILGNFSEYGSPAIRADEFFNKIMRESGAEIFWPSRLKLGAKTKKEMVDYYDLGRSVYHRRHAGGSFRSSCPSTKAASFLSLSDFVPPDHPGIVDFASSYGCGGGGGLLAPGRFRSPLSAGFANSNEFGYPPKMMTSHRQPLQQNGGVRNNNNANNNSNINGYSRELPPRFSRRSSAAFNSVSPPRAVVRANSAANPTVAAAGATPTVEKMENDENNIAGLGGANTQGQQRGSKTLIPVFDPDKPRLLDTFIERNEEYWKNRITLKVDISFSDHSHIIGQKGANTQSVMKETGCHIHFPDSNRDPRYEKSNQVSIAGPIKTVERARARLRNLAPITLSFPLNFQHDQVEAVLENSPLVNQVRQMHRVDVFVRRVTSTGLWHLLVRANAANEHHVKEATDALIHSHGDRKRPVVTSTLEVTSLQQPFVIGVNGINIKAIELYCGVQVRYPRCEESSDTTFVIQGFIDNVLKARKYLIGCLPLVLIFELKSEYQMQDVERLQSETGLQISIKAKRQDRGAQSNGVQQTEELENVIVKGPERDATKIFSIRSRFTGDAETIFCTDYDLMHAWDPVAIVESAAQRLAVSLFPHFRHHPAQLPIIIRDSPPHLHQHGGTLAQELEHLSPATLTDQSRLSAPSNQGMMKLSPVPARVMRGQTMTSEAAAAALLASTSAESAFTNSTFSSSQSSLSSDVSVRTQSISPFERLMNELPPISPIEAPTHDNEIAACIKDGAKRIQDEQQTKWKTVGLERKLRDYNEKRIIAARALMENKPSGNLRVPNPSFMGYFFSASTPQEVLQQHLLEQINKDHSLETHIEDEEEDRLGPWIIDKPKVLTNPNATSYFDFGMQTMSFNNLINGDEELPQLLMKLNLLNYLDAFTKQEVDIESFCSLTKEDLQSLGIRNSAHLTRMLLTIDYLNNMRRTTC